MGLFFLVICVELKGSGAHGQLHCKSTYRCRRTGTMEGNWTLRIKFSGRLLNSCSPTEPNLLVASTAEHPGIHCACGLCGCAVIDYRFWQTAFYVTLLKLNTNIVYSRVESVDIRTISCQQMEVFSIKPISVTYRVISVMQQFNYRKTSKTWKMASSGMLRRMALVRTDVSEELSASVIRATRIGELGTTQAATSNRRTLRRRRQVPPKRRFLQEPHGVTSQKTPFFTVTAVKTANLT
jgi:hypothetical protein